jgi:hypothetical protein
VTDELDNETTADVWLPLHENNEECVNREGIVQAEEESYVSTPLISGAGE